MPVITQRIVELFTYNNLRKIHISVADPGSEERGRLRFWGLAPKIFLVNVRQFRGLFKVFGENRGRAPAAPPAPPLNLPLHFTPHQSLAPGDTRV